MFGGDPSFGAEAVTPEGKVKKLVAALLAEFNIVNAKDAGKDIPSDGWYYLPGQSGYGVKGIPDFVGHYLGRFFAVETKAPGKIPTGFQELQIAEIIRSGGAVFFIDGSKGVEEVRKFFLEVSIYEYNCRRGELHRVVESSR